MLKRIGNSINSKAEIGIVPQNIQIGEVAVLANGGRCVAIELNEYYGKFILLNGKMPQHDDIMIRTVSIFSVSVGPGFLGRVVNILGEPIDGKGPIAAEGNRMVEILGPGPTVRKSVYEPLHTGIPFIDLSTPIGRGQTVNCNYSQIGVNAIINQTGNNVYCIYVSLSRKNNVEIVQKLEQSGAMEYTTCIFPDETITTIAHQYYAASVAMTMAEEFRDNGKHAFVVIDGFDSYFDVCIENNLYNNSKNLMDRASKMNDENGGGSLTAMFITDINEMERCDAKIVYIDGEFSLADSYSWVGSAAQRKSTKQVNMKMQYNAYLELKSLTRFTEESSLDAATKQQLTRGKIIHDWIKTIEPQEIVYIEIFSFFINNGYADGLLKPVLQIYKEFKSFIVNNPIVDDINESKQITLDIDTKLKLIFACKEFTQQSGI
jgi:F-type H+-transporting ATPase subunit alpha